MGTTNILNIWSSLFIFFMKWQRLCKVLCLVNCNHEKKFFFIFLIERPYYTLKDGMKDERTNDSESGTDKDVSEGDSDSCHM